MKNVAIIGAVVLALICSQACAQKKSESSGSGQAVTSKAGSNSKSAGTSIERVVSKASKDGASSRESAASGSVDKQAVVKSKKNESTDKVVKSSSQDELTDEEQKKIKSLMRQTLKPFLGVELTDEQRSKADELFSKAVKDYVVKRSRAMITDELQKKQTAAMKDAKSSGKSARDQAKAAFVNAGFSEDQVKVFKATQASLNKAKREFGKSLNEEQIQGLPESVREIIAGTEK